jgi:hypothetical protein
MLLQVKNVTSNDTVNVGSGGTNSAIAKFGKIKSVANVFAGAQAGNTNPTFSGTVVTIAQTGLSGDTVFLLIVGDSV